MPDRNDLIVRLNDMATMLGNHPSLVRIGTDALTQDAWRGFAAERYLTAMIFASLLDAAIDGAKQAKDCAVARELEKNRDDELGIVDDVVDQSAAHATWRKNFYDTLGVTDEMLNAHIGSPAAKGYMDVMQSVLRTGEYLVITGTILALERFFPVEFGIMKKGRDILFADAFADNPRSRLYLDDHIAHDASAHYPDLLAALEPHVENDGDMARINAGIDAAENAKRAFYDALAA